MKFLDANLCEYSVNSAYKLLTGHGDSCARFNWRWVWRLPCSQRKLGGGRYLRTVFRRGPFNMRGLASTMVCQCCCEEAEGIKHLLLRCSWSVEVWRALELDDGRHQRSFLSISWLDWLRMGRSCDREEQKKFCSILYTAWEIWKQHNAWIFQGQR